MYHRFMEILYFNVFAKYYVISTSLSVLSLEVEYHFDIFKIRPRYQERHEVVLANHSKGPKLSYKATAVYLGNLEAFVVDEERVGMRITYRVKDEVILYL